MKNYAAGDPVGNNQMRIYGAVAPFKAITGVQTASQNGSTSSLIGLTVNTTAVEVAANGAAAYVRWGSASVAGTSYDHVIPAGTYRRFVVPINSQFGVAPNHSVVGANTENGLFTQMAVATDGAASVYTAQYGSSNSY